MGYVFNPFTGQRDKTGTGLSDAPSNGTTYGRNNASWLAITGGGDMLGSANLSDVASVATSRTNLGVDPAGTDNSTNVTLAGTGTYISIAGQVITVDQITESDIADLGAYITNITGSPLSELSDVTITTIATGEVLKWDGLKWVNQTLAEAGISATGHTHTASEVTDFQTTVSANSDVANNTTKNSYPTADSTKLSGIEANADVTDTANVTSAGAVMDTELINTSAGVADAGKPIKLDASGVLSSTMYTDTNTTDHTALSNIGTNTHAQIDTHLANTTNPHSVTKTQVGLSNVANLDTTNASNITTGTLPSSVLPPVGLTTVQTAVSEVAMLALTTEEGDVVVRSDLNKSYMHNGGSAGTIADFTELSTPTDSVLSVNGKTGTVSLVTTDIAEGTNLYYTDARVSANSDVANNTAKVTESTTVTTPLVLVGTDVSIPKATSLVNGYLSSIDWTTFNNKLSSFTETDPVFTASSANSITAGDITNLGNLSGTNTGDESTASTTVSGISESATITETNTGTDAVRHVTPAGLAGSTLQANVTTNNAKIGITPTQASDITANNAKVSFDSTSSTRLANTSGTNTGDQVIPVVSDVAYSATTWNTNTDAPSKNAVRDKVETMNTAIGLNTAKVSDVNHVASSTTTDLTEGTNLYYTDTRVSANSAVALNTAKVTNATHTGDVTGDTALTIANDAVTADKLSATFVTAYLASTFTLADNTSWQDTLLDLVLPSAGTWVITYNVRMVINHTASHWGAFRIWNETTSLIAATEATQLIGYTSLSQNNQWSGTKTIIITTTAANRIRLEAKVGGTGYSSRTVDSDVNGYTSGTAYRIA